ncbi:MAG: cytochrome c biogenesis protein CcdA [Coriobacteriia bacterium]|nr:cytochrome c biogenesis protein CcdA [Coriobacteriia bacterium]
MHYVIVFLEGVITFISPCLLPLLPVYLSFFAAGKENKQRALVNSLGFVLGFTIIFVALGAFAGTVGRFFLEHTTIINIIAGLVVIIFGLNFCGLIKIGFLNRVAGKDAPSKELRFSSALVFGIVFSIGWTPCVGAFLGSALMLASQQGSTLVGVLMLLVYSLGLGVPFVLSAVLVDRLKDAFDTIKRNYQIINIVSGCFLIIVGILMATGLLGRALTMLSF